MRRFNRAKSLKLNTMKHTPLLFIAALSTHLAAEITPIIRQTTTSDDGTPSSVKYLENVSGLSGSAPAYEAISTSAYFELFSIDDNNQRKAHDKQSVATYLPEAVITITSVDSDDGIAKTRVDTPFSVNIAVSGLLRNDPDAQDAAKWVNVYHQLTEYAESSTEIDGNETVSQANETRQIKRNRNVILLNNVITQIPSSDLSTLCGEEQISVFAQPDFGFETPTQLAIAKIKVWPMTSGSLTGINHLDELLSIPPVTVSYVNAYPGSNDRGNESSLDILLYPGEKKTSLTQQDFTDYSLVSMSTSTWADLRSDSFLLGRRKLNRKFNKSNKPHDNNKFDPGIHTIEFVQRTVCAAEPDRIDSLSFNYCQTLRINANIHTSN